MSDSVEKDPTLIDEVKKPVKKRKPKKKKVVPPPEPSFHETQVAKRRGR